MDTYSLVTVQDLDTKAFSNDNTFAEQGISIAISQDEGNTLVLRNDGLYVGDIAHQTKSNIYVSNKGDDTADGTRANPIRTIEEAFKRQDAGTKFTIHLHEGQSHGWRSSSLKYTTNKNYSFRTYGETVDYALINNTTGSEDYWKSKEIMRATIKFVCDTTTTYDSKYALARVFTSNPNNETINRFYGLILDTTPAEPSDSVLHPEYMGYIGTQEDSQNLIFVGCEFVLRDRLALFQVGNTSRVVIDTCQIKPDTANKVLGHIHAGGKVSLLIAGSNQVDGTEYNSNLHQRGTPAETIWKDLFTKDKSNRVEYTLE